LSPDYQWSYGEVAALSTQPSISQVVQSAGQELAASTGGFADVLNETLNRLLVWPAHASRGVVRGAEGQETGVFGTIIHGSSYQGKPRPQSSDYDADSVACVIDVNESLDTEMLRGAYGRVACAKRLKKGPPPNVQCCPVTNVTLGIVFARNATVPIEELAEELDRLNRQHPDREWTDMVVVLSSCVINYVGQFPGEGITGDFLPPVEGAAARHLPPAYVVLVVRPTGRFTFNKMCGFLMAHLALFFSGTGASPWHDILEGSPREALTITGYQYNLAGNLMPVPRQFYNDRYLPPRPFLIEDQQGNLLATLQFVPWQDGGVVLLRGNFPLTPLLIYLGKDVLAKGEVVSLPGGQISNVLPMTQEDFHQMLQCVQRQSGLVVKLDPAKSVIQKMADEGSCSPFMARLYMGLLRLRDVVFPERAEQDVFDSPYRALIQALLNARTASQQINQLVSDHFVRLARGEIAKVSGHMLIVEMPIDKELRKEVETFLNCAVRTLKQGMQEVATALGKDIAFLFKKQGAFEDGIRALAGNDPSLASYLAETRTWSERLISCRNAMEHDGWILPGVKYAEVSGTIHADEPEISGQKVSGFAVFIVDRLACFVEEVSVHCLAARMPAGVAVTEIPLSHRDAEMPLRFQPTTRAGGMPIWSISYHQRSFAET